MNKIVLVLIMFLISGPSFAGNKLIFKNAWVREAPPMAKNLAGYAEVMNIGKKALTIVSISSPVFEKVDMHITTIINGMMRMNPVETLTIMPGESVFFEPGGKHFMLSKPKKPIKSGLIVPLDVSFEAAKTIRFELEVRR